MGIQLEEGIERKTLVLSPALQLKQNSLCGLRCSGDQGGGGLNSQIISVKRAADGRRQRSWKIIDEEREKSTGPRMDSCITPQRT